MFDWADFLDLARQLARQTNNGAALRSAISRAYYAVFGLAHRRLVQHGHPFHTGQLHHQVWRIYQASMQRDCRRIGELGFLLRDLRNGADYDDPLPFPLASQVEIALLRADQLVGLLARLDPTELCS